MGSSQPQTTESTTVTIQISMKTTSNLCKEIMEQMKSFTNVDDYEYNGRLNLSKMMSLANQDGSNPQGVSINIYDNNGNE
jgi:hypothetical protein